MSLSVFELRRRRRQRANFSERVANGKVTKEELLNAPEWLRDFDEAEDAILAQSHEEPEEELESTRKTRLFLEGCVLTEDPLVLKLIVSKLPAPLVSAIIQQLIQELSDVESEIDHANDVEEEQEEQEEQEEEEQEEEQEEEEEEEEEEEDSIASRLLKRRRKERGQHY